MGVVPATANGRVQSRQHQVALGTFGALIATRTDMTGPVMTPN